MRRREGLEGDSSTGELSPSNCGRIAWGFRPGRRGNRGSCRARPRCLAGGGTTGGVALRAPGPPPPRSVLGTAEMAAALVANPGTTICTDGCAGGTCVGGRAQAFVWAAILTATAPAVANRYTFSIREKWVEGPLELRTPALPVQRRRVTTTLPRATRMQLNHQSAKPSRSPAIGPLTHLVEELSNIAQPAV